MAFDLQEQHFTQDCMNLAQRIVELRNDMQLLVARESLNGFSNAVNGITDDDLTNGPNEFKHLTNNELATFRNALVAGITNFGSDSDGNTLLGASVKLIG